MDGWMDGRSVSRLKEKKKKKRKKELCRLSIGCQTDREMAEKTKKERRDSGGNEMRDNR
jgi:hypothetical protein